MNGISKFIPYDEIYLIRQAIKLDKEEAEEVKESKAEGSADSSKRLCDIFIEIFCNPFFISFGVPVNRAISTFLHCYDEGNNSKIIAFFAGLIRGVISTFISLTLIYFIACWVIKPIRYVGDKVGGLVSRSFKGVISAFVRLMHIIYVIACWVVKLSPVV